MWSMPMHHKQAGQQQKRRSFTNSSKKWSDKSPQDQYLIIGDFNAKLNGRTEDENNHIGPHVYNPDEEQRDRAKAEVQENRELFMLAVIQNDWVVKNTWFQKTDREQIAFRTKGAVGWKMEPGTFEQLDHVLVPRRWANSIKHVETDTKSGLYSDHFPTKVEIRTRFKKQENIRSKQQQMTVQR